MKTKTLISRISRAYPSVARPTILDQINVALGIIIDRPLAFMRIIDESTGKDPVLSTVTGQLTYEANIANLGYDAQYITRVYTGEDEDARDCDPVAYSTRVALGTGNATIVLEADPIDDSIKVQAYRGVIELQTEVFPVHIPFPEALVSRYLYKLVAGLFEEEFHGKSLKLDEFYARDIDVLRGEANTALQNNVSYESERYY